MSIKSYIGRRPKKQKGSNENIKVSDYMTRKLITFHPEEPVLKVMDTLIRKRISGGPVVNEKNELVGMISEGDCIMQISNSRYHNHPIQEVKVQDHMVTDVETIDGNMSVFDAADRFLASRRRRFPVIEEGKLVGQISQKDVLKAALKLKGNSWK